MQRCDWADLPEAVRHEVGRRCGLVRSVRPIAAGMNNAAAGVIELASGGGQVFYKGIRTGDPRVWMFRNEIAAAEAARSIPSLRWTIKTEDWLLLGWDCIEGRHADLAPTSADLDLIARAVRELSEQPPLDDRVKLAHQAQRWERLRAWSRLATAPPERLDPWVRANLDRFAEHEDAALALAAGNHLAHTDLHELNILIDRDRAHLIDWAWARGAAPWVDAEMLALRLVAAGHPSPDADRWRLASLPYPDIDPEIRRMFAVEMLGVWLYLAASKREWPLFARMSGHALKWARHLHEIA